MSIAKNGINNKIEWKMKMHMAGKDYHSLLYRAEFMGERIQCEIHTPVTKTGFGKAKVYFFIDGDERKYKTEEGMIKAIQNR